MKKVIFVWIMGHIFLLGCVQIFGQADQTLPRQDKDTIRGKELPERLKSLIENYQEQQEEETNTAETEENLSTELALDGLIIDETMSKMGHDFYIYFYDNWSVPSEINNYTIYISEKPAPGMGTLISIKINYEEVFRNRISPSQEVIHSIADYAIYQSQQHLINYKEIQNQLGKDMQGTGIY